MSIFKDFSRKERSIKAAEKNFSAFVIRFNSDNFNSISRTLSVFEKKLLYDFRDQGFDFEY
ncbi:hypothetical protein CH375_20560 [Leptospira ellisii]|uniref:Uncharacterized protein n=1 Tax=Leptospira ellisii TaxID=2023197 RepID=A0A2N0B4Y1_9LEPT|nr:hypothetical protein CH379_17765 [Leptospira ellisii]PKA02840.1 hypothetical protein CH375_20560 [Leptospira ellisii]